MHVPWYQQFCLIKLNTMVKNSMTDVRTQPGEIVFNTMRYKSGKTVQRLGYKILKVKVTTVRLKVKSRSHHDIAHLQL